MTTKRNNIKNILLLILVIGISISIGIGIARANVLRVNTQLETSHGLSLHDSKHLLGLHGNLDAGLTQGGLLDRAALGGLGLKDSNMVSLVNLESALLG